MRFESVHALLDEHVSDEFAFEFVLDAVIQSLAKEKAEKKEAATAHDGPPHGAQPEQTQQGQAREGEAQEAEAQEGGDRGGAVVEEEDEEAAFNAAVEAAFDDAAEEHRIVAPRDGVVELVHVGVGDQVDNAQLLVTLAEEE